MAFSRLQPDTATMTGIFTAVGVYFIYNNALPKVTDLRSAPPHDPDAEAARKAAAWKSAGLITVVFLVARDLNSYIISGAALIGIDYMFKHANSVHPNTGKPDVEGAEPTPLAQAYPMPDYTEIS